MKFKLVLFDLGGTLINYENSSWLELGRLGCIEGVKYIREALNFDIEVEELDSRLHNAVGRMIKSRDDSDAELDLIDLTGRILKELGVNITDGLPEKFIEAYYKPIRDQITLVPYAREILSKIKDAGMRIGLVSNTIFPADYHRTEMREFGLYDFFGFALFSSEEKIRKPGKEIFLRALKLGKSDPGDTVFIGDRLEEDIAGPQSVGIKAILKCVDGREYSSEITPFETIRDLKELENIVLI
ncbi:MAG: HAD family hydrolase [Candidatus Zixiibacteriota bacterium]|nr:MAG: HAD family hydrolase [candidate division Zixibacteria bacterium]